MIKIRKSILEITPYKPGESGDDENVIKLSANENGLGCSDKVTQALQNLTELNRYPDGGSCALRKEIAGLHNISENEIICGSGSDEIIGLIISTFADAGDEMIYTEHGFLMYKIYALSAGLVPVAAKELNLKTDINEILKVVTPKTKLVFIANPNNPTGSYITSQELRILREKLPNDVILVIDGAYSEYVDEADYEDGFRLVREYENVIATRTFSKIYGIPSVRLGYGYMREELIDILNRTRSPFNVNSLAQKLGIAALNDQGFIAKSKAHNDKWLKKLTSHFEAINITVLPSVANFLLLDLGSVEKANKFAEFLKNKGIIVRSVASYNLAQMVRITIGSDKENEVLLRVTKNYK